MVALLCIEEELNDLYHEHRASVYAFSHYPVNKIDLPSHRADAVATSILMAERREMRRVKGHTRLTEINDWLDINQLRSRWNREMCTDPHDVIWHDRDMSYLRGGPTKRGRPL